MIALSHGNQMDDELACRFVGNATVPAILPPAATAPVLVPCVRYKKDKGEGGGRGRLLQMCWAKNLNFADRKTW